MATTAYLLRKAAEVIEEIRSQFRCQSDRGTQETSLDDLFNELQASLDEVGLEATETEKEAVATIENTIETSKLASEEASRISTQISNHRNVFTEATPQQLYETLKGAEDSRKELIAQLEQECLETKYRMQADLEEARQAKLKLDEESKQRAADLRAVHLQNLSSLQDSFHVAMQELEARKDHTLCQLRLKSLETRGRETIRRLETEIVSVRDEIRETRKVASKQARDSLSSVCQNSSAASRTTAIKKRRSAPAAIRVGSTEASEKENPVKRPRRELFREEEENEPRVEEESVVTTLEGKRLEAYLLSLKKIVGEHRGRRSKEAVVP